MIIRRLGHDVPQTKKKAGFSSLSEINRLKGLTRKQIPDTASVIFYRDNSRGPREVQAPRYTALSILNCAVMMGRA